MAEDVAEKLQIDIERRTTRGRVCPVCGGKIIPSRRAVYESKADPTAVLPPWECERCRCEEERTTPAQSDLCDRRAGSLCFRRLYDLCRWRRHQHGWIVLHSGANCYCHLLPGGSVAANRN